MILPELYGLPSAGIFWTFRTLNTDMNDFHKHASSPKSSTWGAFLLSHAGFGGDYHYSDSKSNISLAIEDGPVISYPKPPQIQPLTRLDIKLTTRLTTLFLTQIPPASKSSVSIISIPSASMSEGYRRPPMPPPSSNTGFLGTLFPGTTANRLPEAYINMPASRPSGPSARPGFRSFSCWHADIWQWFLVMEGWVFREGLVMVIALLYPLILSSDTKGDMLKCTWM